MVNEELQAFVENFKKEFKDRFGYRPYVFYTNETAVSTVLTTSNKTPKLSTVSFDIIEKVANKLLKATVSYKGLPYYPITSRKRQRDVINFKHCTMKVMYSMGYTVVSIGNLLNVSHCTVSVALAKINDFINMGDDITINIINAITNEIKEQTRPNDLFQSDTRGENNT